MPVIYVILAKLRPAKVIKINCFLSNEQQEALNYFPLWFIQETSNLNL